MGDSAYSFSLTTFSRTGKLLQIEYALNAVANGRTALGIAAVDGVVIATDKKFGSALVDAGQVRKVEKITDGSGFVYAGVGPDYRVLGECVCVPWRGGRRRRGGERETSFAVCLDPPPT
jgi:20S proteasome subunit alpha 2